MFALRHQCSSFPLEIGVLHSLGAFAGDSSDCRTMTPADQEDGAPRQRKCKAKGGNKAYGENIERAPREWDLSESQARDLEYQKGALFE